MFDKRLFKELREIRGYFIIGAAAAIAVVLLTIYQAHYLALIIDRIFLKRIHLTALVRQFALLSVIICLRVLVGSFADFYYRNSSLKIKKSLKGKLIKAFVFMGPIKLRDEKSGRLASLSQEGIEMLDSYYSEYIPQIIMIAAAVPMLLFTTFRLDIVSGIIMLVTAPLIPVFMFLIGKLSEYYNKKHWKALQKMSGHFLDILKGLTTLKLFGRSRMEAENIFRISEGYRKSTMEVLKISFLSALVLELAATISTAMLAVTLGVRLIYGKIHFYEAFFILLLAPEFYQPLRQFGAKFHAAMGAHTAADSIYGYINNQKSTGKETVDNINKKPEGDISIEIEGLVYSYGNSNKALQGINLKVEPGTRVALVGPSGAGKSTLASIIMGFIRDYEGVVRINGIDLVEKPLELWTSYYAYVPQHPRLFKDTILANIAAARPEAEYEEIMEAARISGVDSFTRLFPEGYETRVGEGGIALSGGQTQLIAIARAYLKAARLMIFDEPTSALDPETEGMVSEAITRVSAGKTVIIIAHRITTIMNSDLVYVMDEGRIEEKGAHRNLMQQMGLYGRLLTAGEGVS